MAELAELDPQCTVVHMTLFVRLIFASGALHSVEFCILRALAQHDSMSLFLSAYHVGDM